MPDRRRRIVMAVTAVAILAVLLVLPQLISSAAWMNVALLVLDNSCAAVGLTLLFGFAGQISLAQAAFVGVGAYAPAILAVQLQWDPWIGLPVGVVAAVAIAYLIGRPVLRLEGLYLAIATAAFNIIFIVVVQQSTPITGGNFGLTGVPPLSVFGTELFDPAQLYYLVLVALVVLLALSYRLLRSPLGLMFLALGHDSRAAGLAGVPVAALKVKTFALSAAFAAVAGFFLTASQGVVTPDSFGILPSVYLLVMVVVGGMRSLVGAVVGAAFVSIVPQLIPSAPRAQEVLFAVSFLVIVMVLPSGIAGRATWGWLPRRFSRVTGPLTDRAGSAA